MADKVPKKYDLTDIDAIFRLENNTIGVHVDFPRVSPSAMVLTKELPSLHYLSLLKKAKTIFACANTARTSPSVTVPTAR